MVRYFYPAIVRRTESGSYTATMPNFPDIRETQVFLGDLMDALKKDIGDFLCDKKLAEFRPIVADTLQAAPPAFLLMIEYDEMNYNKKYRSKAVTKTLTIPFWMNELVKQYNLPVSKLLQDAIIQHLGLQDKDEL